MILVKSLIVLFLLLLFARFARPIANFLLNLFDERENFANAYEVGTYEAKRGTYASGTNAIGANAIGANAIGANAVGTIASAVGPEKYIEETKYTGQLPSASETGLSNDAKLITDMQFKLNELMQLKEESIIISKLVENHKQKNA